jgi:hypothetical protein
VEVINSILRYILDALVLTATQIFIILGPLIILSLIMHFISAQNEKAGCRIFGVKAYLYVFAWLGTAIHELGHAVFALIFGHKIHAVRLFSPDPVNGTLGYVKHSYNKNSIYQNIGNFFIGIGPIILGAVCIYLISLILYGKLAIRFNTIFDFSILNSFDAVFIILLSVFTDTKTFISDTLVGSNSAWWKTCIMIYFIFSAGTSVSLSFSDIRTARKGLIFTMILIFSLNLASLWAGNYISEATLYLSKQLSPLYFLILLSIAINLIFMIVLKIIEEVKNIISR